MYAANGAGEKRKQSGNASMSHLEEGNKGGRIDEGHFLHVSWVDLWYNIFNAPLVLRIERCEERQGTVWPRRQGRAGAQPVDFRAVVARLEMKIQRLIRLARRALRQRLKDGVA